MNYLDFDLQIEAIGAGNNYRARVLTSPAGQAECHFILPFDEKDLRIFVLSVGRTRIGVRKLNSPQMREATEFGSDLYRAVFQDQVQGCLLRSLDEADKQGAGLRLRLRLDGKLINLPWEFLYDTTHRRFFSHSNRTPIVRFLDVPQRISALSITLPLKVLVMIASPSDYAPLDVEREWQKVKDAVKTLEDRGLLQLTRLENGTLAALRRKLLSEQFHVFHYIGHGSYDDENEEGVLLLEDENGRGRRVSGTHLGTLLHDHTALRLVLLNACEGARSAVTDLFAGVAQHLVLQGLPAVIAMQFEITDHAAITLAQAFYEALGTGSSVDAALTEARKAIFAEGNDVEWATPVLYMRAIDGRLFDLPKLLPKPETEIQREGGNGGNGAGVSQPTPTSESKAQTSQPWLSYAIGVIAILIAGWLGIPYLRDGGDPTTTPTPVSVGAIAANTPAAPIETDTPTAVATNATITPTLPAAAIVATATATVPTATLTATEQPTETPTLTPSVTSTATPTMPTATATVPIATLTATGQLTETPTLIHTVTPMSPTATPILLTATATFLAGMSRNATAGQVWTEPLSKIDFVYIPAGDFLMGSTPQQVKDAGELCKKYYPDCPVGWFMNELTQTTISTEAYWIGKTETTNAQFKQFVDADGYRNDVYWTEAGVKWRNENKVTQPDCWENKDFKGDIQPVVCVSWYEALAYTKWLSQQAGLTVRLPNEAEWEKAARGINGQIYPWGNDFDGTRLNYCDKQCNEVYTTTTTWADLTVIDGYASTAPVGSFLEGASPYGALDMAGNVWEWASSQYRAYPYLAEEGREDETVADALRVLRGGSWDVNPYLVRTALRSYATPAGRNYLVGFRVALSAHQ